MRTQGQAGPSTHNCRDGGGDEGGKRDMVKLPTQMAQREEIIRHQHSDSNIVNRMNLELLRGGPGRCSARVRRAFSISVLFLPLLFMRRSRRGAATHTEARRVCCRRPIVTAGRKPSGTQALIAGSGNCSCFCSCSWAWKNVPGLLRAAQLEPDRTTLLGPAPERGGLYGKGDAQQRACRPRGERACTSDAAHRPGSIIKVMTMPAPRAGWGGAAR